MIIIYNLSGLLIGVLGIVLGLVTAKLTGWLPTVPLVIGVVWILFGWRKRDPEQPELYRRAPSVFIPLRIWGVLVLLAVIPMAQVDRVSTVAKPSNPHMGPLDVDEQSLRTSTIGGDADLSQIIRKELIEIADAEVKAEEFHVFTRISDRAVLVLLQADNLRRFSDQARRELIDVITFTVRDRFSTARELYIGVRGRIAYGAIAWPPDQTRFGRVVVPDPLLGFYEERSPATSGPAAGTARATTYPADPSTEPLTVGRSNRPGQ